MRVLKFAVCLISLSGALFGAEPSSAESFRRVIRANDLKALKEMSQTGVAEVRDRLEWTPLHYAALYGSTEAVRLVLAAGGDPNAVNRSKVTPLMMGAYDLEKTRLLVEKGGNVNALSSDGTTALWVAMGARGNDATIRFLIEKGADLKYVMPSGADYMLRAAAQASPAVLKLLIEKGMDPGRVAPTSGDTALTEAIDHHTGEKVRLLLARGVDVNVANKDAGSVRNGPIERTGVTPLMEAAAVGEPAILGALLSAGAKVNAQDDRKMTALMMAVATDRPVVEKVRQLIAAGADVNIADRNGETALDWARKQRNPEVLALLTKAGAREKGLIKGPLHPVDYKPDARAAIERASGLLAKSSEEFFREGGGCTGCHHQPWAGKAYGAVKAAGMQAEPRLRQTMIDAMVAERARELNRQAVLSIGGGGYDSFLYALSGLADMGEPASDVSDVMVHVIAESQEESGGWSRASARPPLQESEITRTMLAIQALKTYGWPARQAEFAERIAKGRGWLKTAEAAATLDEVDRLMGLWLAGETPAELRKLGQKVLAMQRADGGWAQTPYLESDAFGTAAALHTLRKTGMLKVSDATYQKGAQYLLSTQFPDGSWYVRSRAVKLQPYFQSAFPYNHDQWISNTATAYAVMALAPTAGPEVRAGK